MESPPERPVRVLVVDDDDQLVRSLLRVFRARGLEADGVGNGRDAVERLAADAYDVVLVDVTMPIMSGLELLDHILAARVSCQVVLMTGVPQLRNAVVAMRRGAYGLVAKPFRSHDEVLVEVLDAARTHRLKARGGPPHA